MHASSFAEQIELAAILAAGLGLILGLALGILLVLGRRVPGALLPLALALPAVVVLAFTAGQPGPEAGLEALHLEVTRAIGNRLLLFFLLAPVSVIVLLFTAVAGARRAPRRWWAAGLGGALVAAVALTALLGGYADESPEFGWLRALAYAVSGALAAVALLAGGGREDSGWDAAAAAGPAWALLVAAGEASVRSLNELLLVLEAARVEPALRATFVEAAFADGVDAASHYGWIAVGLAASLGAVGILVGLRDRRRAATSVPGLVWLALAAAVVVVGDVTPEVVVRLVTLLP